MTTKTTKSMPDTKSKNPNALTLQASTEEERAAKGSAMATNGSVNAMLVRAYMPIEGVGVTDIHTAMLQQADDLKADGDRIHQAEAMLLNQAVALQAMFIDLASRAKLQTHRDFIQTLTGLALRAQSNCANTLKVLSEIRNPRQSAVFARQANIAHGPQQVNNGCSANTDPNTDPNVAPNTTQPDDSGVCEGPFVPNELLEDQYGKAHEELRLDTGKTGKAGRVDQNMETVGAVHRAQKR